MWVSSQRKELSDQEMGGCRTLSSPARPGGSVEREGASACTHCGMEAVVPQTPSASENTSASQTACPGWQSSRARRKEKLFLSLAHSPLLIDGAALRGGLSFLESRGAQGSSGNTDIKGLRRAETMPCHHQRWHEGSDCSSDNRC